MNPPLVSPASGERQKQGNRSRDAEDNQAGCEALEAVSHWRWSTVTEVVVPVKGQPAWLASGDPLIDRARGSGIG